MKQIYFLKLLQLPEVQDQPTWICVYYTLINLTTVTTVGHSVDARKAAEL